MLEQPQTLSLLRIVVQEKKERNLSLKTRMMMIYTLAPPPPGPGLAEEVEWVGVQ